MRHCHQKMFEEIGLKNTAQRDAVFHALERLHAPKTAEEIYLDTVAHKQDISLSTVYRILETFVEKEMIQKITLANQTSVLYELSHHEHEHHLICLSCKKVIRITGCPLENYEEEVASKHHFKVDHHQLYLYGYCADCQK